MLPLRKENDGSMTQQARAGSAGLALTRRFPIRQGLPPQFAHALEVGTGSDLVNEWIALGRPYSMKAEKRARRTRNVQPLSLGRVQNNPTSPVQHDVVYRVTKCGCGRQTCDGCRQKLGVMAKRSLLDRIKELQREHRTRGDQQMWTLSTAQDYASPEDAYDSIRSRERVGKLIRKMGWKYAITILEWTEKGWPHWHVVVWEPKRRMYYCKHEVQKAWGEGNVRYSGSHGQPAEKAINYVIQYLTNVTKHPTPDWALDRANIRTMNTTRPWGPINAKRRRSEEIHPASHSTQGERADIRNNREAIAECGNQTVVMKEYIDSNGELKIEFVERLNIEYRYMRRMLTRGKGWKDRVKSCLGHIRVPTGTPEHERLQHALVSYKI